MKLDNKQQMLLAIYTEYQKDLPDMAGNITPEKLGIDTKVFQRAIVKLQNEDMIKNASALYADDDIYVVLVGNVVITSKGIEYVEHILNIDANMNKESRLRTIIENAGKWGLTQIKDVAAMVLAEVVKSSIGLKSEN